MMAPRAKELPADLGRLESQKLAERIQTDLEACQSKISEMESRLSVVALDSLSDPAAFEKLELLVIAERKRAHQLSLALNESERRIQAEFADLRRKNERARIDRVLKHLSARDEIGAEVERLSIELAAKFKALIAAGDKVRNSASGLLPDSPGFLTGAGELEQALSNAFWKASAADISELITGRPGAIKVPPPLPGSQPIMRTGSPTPYTPAEAPSLTSRLQDATAFAKSILQGERTFAGPLAETPPPSAWIWPGRESAILESYAARERGTFPAPRTASPQLMPGETEIEFAKRLAATPIEPMSKAEREALTTPPAGPTMSHAEAMAVVTGGSRASPPYDETKGWPKKAGDEW